MPDEEQITEETAAPRSKMALRIALVVAGITLFSVALLVYRSNLRQEAELQAAAEAAAAKPRIIHIEDPDYILTGAMLPLAPMTLNLRSENSFLKLAVVVEYFEFQLPPDIERQKAKLRDAVIQVVTEKTAQELLSIEGKSKLRLELIRAMNRTLAVDDPNVREDVVVDVYFSEFTIQ